MLLPLLVPVACGEDDCCEQTDLIEDDTQVAGDVMEEVVETWPAPFEPGVEVRGNLKILRLKGTYYEMGRQHATFLRDQLLIGVDTLENDPTLSMLEPLAEALGFIDEAMVQSYPSMLDECQGMADVLGDEGWTMGRCIALAYGEVILELMTMPSSSCTQFAAKGAATGGGELLHGRNLDWDMIPYLLEHPVVIVRAPEGRIPYVVVGFPGNVAPYNGINAAGLAIASNENSTKDDKDRTGRSSVQMQAEILATATSLAEARAFIEAQDRMTSENLLVSDGANRTAAVFELTANNMAVTEIGQSGVVYITNHFVHEDMVPLGTNVSDDASTKSRFMRVKQLLEPGHADSVHGSLDIAAAVSVLRDRYNPIKDTTAAEDAFDNEGTIANNGCIYSMVFAPERRMFWLATGDLPIPANTFVGFSVDELLGLGEAAIPDPVQIQ
jgi:hypothetical protein